MISAWHEEEKPPGLSNKRRGLWLPGLVLVGFFPGECKEILSLRKGPEWTQLLPLAARWVLGNGAELMGTSRHCRLH